MKTWTQVVDADVSEERKENRQWVLWEKRIKKEAEKQDFMVGRFDVKYVRPRARVSQDLIRVKSFVDFVISIDGMSTYFDAKVCSHSVWNLKKYVFNEDKIHQFATLTKAERTGNQAGYLIHFFVARKIVWAPASSLQWCLDHLVASIHPFSKIPGLRVMPDDQIIDFKYLFFGVGAEKYEQTGEAPASEGEGYSPNPHGQLEFFGEAAQKTEPSRENEDEHPEVRDRG